MRQRITVGYLTSSGIQTDTHTPKEKEKMIPEKLIRVLFCDGRWDLRYLRMTLTVVLLPTSPTYWDYKHMPSCLVYVVVEIKPRVNASQLLTELHSQLSLS